MYADDDDDRDDRDDRDDDPLAPALAMGACCACGCPGPTVRNILTISRRGPTPGQGWGCLACALPPDGALAVVCDPCLDAERPLQTVCAGYVTDPARVPYASLAAAPFDHTYPLVGH